MKDKRLLILLGNQLFPNDKIQESGCSQVFMAEDYELCTYEKHHKLKILMFLASMREKRDELIKSGYKVDYFDIEHALFKKSYLTKLQTIIEKKSIQRVVLFEVEDKPFENKLLNFLEGIDLSLEVLPSPMFKLARHEFSDFKGHKNTLRMGSFYKDMRKQFDVLLDENNDMDYKKEIVNLIGKACKKLGLENGPVHVEFKIHNKEIAYERISSFFTPITDRRAV